MNMKKRNPPLTFSPHESWVQDRSESWTVKYDLFVFFNHDIFSLIFLLPCMIDVFFSSKMY